MHGSYGFFSAGLAGAPATTPGLKKKKKKTTPRDFSYVLQSHGIRRARSGRGVRATGRPFFLARPPRSFLTRDATLEKLEEKELLGRPTCRTATRVSSPPSTCQIPPPFDLMPYSWVRGSHVPSMQGNVVYAMRGGVCPRGRARSIHRASPSLPAS